MNRPFCAWICVIVSGTFALVPGCGQPHRDFASGALGGAGSNEQEPDAGQSGAQTDGGSSGQGENSAGGLKGLTDPGGAGAMPPGGAAGGGDEPSLGGVAGEGPCTKNACGGCVTLTGSPGDACGDCGELSCNGADSLVCETTCKGATHVCKTDANTCVACNVDADCGEAVPVCHANACVVCKPSGTRCAGTRPMLCDAKGSKETPLATQAGTCGAVCTGGKLRCSGQIGQKCATDGTGYVSSGSNKQCGCSDPARFSLDADGNVKDSQTNLVWDFAEHAPDTQAGASGTCAARGMRLPTRAEFLGLLITGAVATTCTNNLQLSVDSVAFPAILNNVRFWTGEPEGIPGFLYVAYFTAGASGTIGGTTDRKTTDLVAFQCVKSGG